MCNQWCQERADMKCVQHEIKVATLSKHSMVALRTLYAEDPMPCLCVFVRALFHTNRSGGFAVLFCSAIMIGHLDSCIVEAVP